MLRCDVCLRYVSELTNVGGMLQCPKCRRASVPLNRVGRDEIASALIERGRRYGSFDTHAAITYALKNVMQNTNNWGGLAAAQKEALDMIAHKIGRILNGDPDYRDSWIDIAGYAKLVADELVG